MESAVHWTEIFLVGISLSMDALAVSIALSAAEGRHFNWKRILLTAGMFGLFQALMPLGGWLGGSLCGTVIRTYGKYVAALLLAGIGGKMIWDSGKEEKVSFGIKALILLAFATSIDAFLVGISFACLGDDCVLPEIVLIGITTFLISLAGCYGGRISGKLLGNKCEVVGGLVLIALAVKIVILG